MPPPDHADVVPQRALIVLPTTGEFDSRAWRIGRALAERGHAVTLLARLGPGLPPVADDPAGYRVLRAPVGAREGLPRFVRPLVPARARSPETDPGSAPGSAGVPVSAGVPAAATAPTRSRGGPVGRARSAVGAVVRLTAIWLTVRSQRMAARRLAPPADIVHAMAYMGIPVGLDLGRRQRVPVLYDARDIYVDARNLARLPGPARRLFGAIERRWARAAARVVTVNRPYAEVMAARWGVDPLVVMNASYRRPSAGRLRLIHDRLGLPEEAAVVLYHGGLSPDRGIEQLLAAVPDLPATSHLVLLGYGPLSAAIDVAAADPARRGRVHRLPAVPPDELLDWVASADVVAMPIQPSTLNHRLTTPNKLFEAMAAGVPVVASDLPGMAPIVAETGCGVLVDPTSPAAIARAIGGLLADPEAAAAMGRRGHAAAQGTYSWEHQLAVLLAEYGRLTGRPW